MAQEPHAVTEALKRYAAGDRAASREIFEFAFPILTRYALRVLRGGPLAGSDEEDIANTSLKALFCGLGDDQWPRTSEDLTRLLFTVAWRKINDRRKWAAHRHGEVAAGGEAGYAASAQAPEDGTPLELVELADEVRACKAALARHDPVLVRILEGQFEERSSEEIAASLGVSLATVKRKVRRIREILREEQHDGARA